MRLQPATILALLICSSAPAIGASRDWSVIVDAFDRVYKPHPECAGNNPGLSEMACSNFRSRALKRFQHEWDANAFWRDGRFVENEAASRRVNSELPRPIKRSGAPKP